jgi:outer membrane receptor protein involved in Fe transport
VEPFREAAHRTRLRPAPRGEASSGRRAHARHGSRRLARRRYRGHSLRRGNANPIAVIDRFEINEDNEAVIGNPDLVPYEAWNFDATAEYYMSSNGALTAGVFYKEIDNFIVGVVVEEPGSFQGIDFQEAETNINGSTADIFGFELGFSQQLDFLPGFLSGFLVQANYTFTDAKCLLPDGELGAITDTPLAE